VHDSLRQKRTHDKTSTLRTGRHACSWRDWEVYRSITCLRASPKSCLRLLRLPYLRLHVSVTRRPLLIPENTKNGEVQPVPRQRYACSMSHRLLHDLRRLTTSHRHCDCALSPRPARASELSLDAVVDMHLPHSATVPHQRLVYILRFPRVDIVWPCSQVHRAMADARDPGRVVGGSAG
jgi:hypothetical protein